MAKAPLDVPELADLLAERHRIITTDWQTASLSRQESVVKEPDYARFVGGGYGF